MAYPQIQFYQFGMNESALTTYRALMVEVKYRIEAIDRVLQGETSLRAKIGEELCYLQLRMICELIAIGCLVLHEDTMFMSQKLLKSYEADRIMGGLESLHPKFFPQPLVQNDVHEEGLPPQWLHLESGFLTKDDLSRLWSREAGGRLHRGSARNVLKSDTPLILDKVRHWRDKIVTLLNRHIVLSNDEKTICYVIMNNDQGEVASNIFKAIP